MTFGLDTLPQVRDADLVQRVAEATPFLRDSIISSCVREQERRDKLSAMPPGQRRRVATQRQIAEESGIQRQDLRHIHSVLAICSLPYTAQPLAVREWQRRQGRMSLMVSAGKLVGRDGEWVDQPLPYGSRARLLLLHTCSEALRQRGCRFQRINGSIATHNRRQVHA